MKKYNFKLQSVLDYRSRQVDGVMQTLAQWEHNKRLTLHKIQETQNWIAASFEQRQSDMVNAKLDPFEAQTFSDYIFGLKQSKLQMEQLLNRIDQHIVTIQQELQAALVKKKSLELLKEKDYKRFKKTVEKIEEETLAEITQARFIREANTNK